MRCVRFLMLLCLGACLLTPNCASAWTVTYLGVATIDATAVPAMSELSGAAYRGPLGGSSHELYAVQDSGNQLVTISFNLAANGTVTSPLATATKTLAPGFDFEGMALGPAGSILVAEETTPAIRRFDETSGAATALLPMPAVFANIQANFAFESLTRAPDGVTYWTGNEEALSVDGPISTTSQGTTVRLQRFSYDSSGTLVVGPQCAYPVDPIHSGPVLSQSRSGLVDLVALPDGTLLALERSLGFLQYENRIYQVTFAGATDTSQAPFNAALIGQSYAPATKTLLWKGQVGGGSGENMEGLVLGPQLPGGDWSLLGVVDDGGASDPLSGTTLAAFSLSPSVEGDFNGSGSVDSADYVVWRKGLGTLFTPSDYGVCRAHFGQTAGSGSAAASFTGVALHEPATMLVILMGLLPLVCRRRI